jgi:divalent metal cation (Fe/Co/Zn/Cd) transporter
MTSRASLTRFAWLSIAAAIVIIALKGAAYWITGSVALLSDALESVINLVAACVALVVLGIVARPWRGRRTKSIPTATTRPSTFRAASKAE